MGQELSTISQLPFLALFPPQLERRMRRLVPDLKGRVALCLDEGVGSDLFRSHTHRIASHRQ